MPELPEMENYRRLLEERVQGQKVTNVEVNRERCINIGFEQFCEQIKGWKVTAVERRAKQLLIRLESGKLLLVHLMLGGWMYFGSGEEDQPVHSAQVVLSFGRKNLYLLGLRFGYVHLLTDADAMAQLADLGPEPLSDDFSETDFRKRISGKRGALKNTLVDQHFISGIGTRYSDEVCFRAQQLPVKRCTELGDEDVAALYQAIPAVLKESIEQGGYMSRSFFEGDTTTGQFADQLKVYNREGETCIRCGHPIEKEKLSSRKVYYCPNCQK
ncbi:MAG TPA: bifunctional DNA-formamidopyrimidine glycosylase/DNA-(apurinic or apyrimidinic site) lyase [Bacillales bacterium]|nr:bifunctional DNA-formamidopyrimidine glycosylase/DNA-(apurinic or apyrimidinic site) lyase [Bacillales bacterium]